MHLVTRNILISVLLLASAAAQGQVARVLEVKGTTLAERAGQPPRILGADDPLDAQQVVTVARDSHVILEFADKARVTLRPGTVFRIDAYREDKPESAIFGLLKGGLRAISGLIAKRNPGAVKYQTASATIGIRGTEFDARLCEEDCAVEDRLRPGPRSLDDPVARVVEMKGTVAAARAGERARMLVPGAAIHERDGVATGANSYAVLVFSDDSRISLAENSRLSVPSFQFDYARHTGSAVVIHHAGEAMVATGRIAKQGPSFYRLITPLGEIKPLGTLFQSVAGAAKQVGETVVGAVQDTAGQAAQDALNAAIRPILQTMSALMSGLRDNPPTTEAGWNDLMSQMTRASDRLHGALDDAIRVGGSVVESREFQSVVGLALAAEFEIYAVASTSGGYDGGEVAGLTPFASLMAMVEHAKASPYQSACLDRVGLSRTDLVRLSQSSRYGAHTIIETEVGGYLASQGNAVANDFFSKAEAAAAALQQRAQQAEAAAARAVAEAEQRAIEDGQRLAEEAREAELEAARLAAEAAQRAEEEATKAVKTGQSIFDEVVEKTDTAVDKAGGATADWVGQTAGDAKDKAGKAAKTGQSIFDEVVEKTDTAVDKVGGTTADWVGQTVGDAKDGAGKVGTATADWVGQTAGDAKAGAGAQSGKALQAIEQIRAAEREFARQVSDLRNALRNATNLSEAEKQRVLGALDEWSRLVGEEVARLTAEVMKNPNAQVALTSLKIMAIVVATVVTVIVVGAVIIPLAALTAVAHTAMTNPSVFEDVPASAITQAARSTDQAAEAMRAILAAMVEHGQLGAGEAQQFMATLGQTLAGQATQAADNAAQAGRDVRDQISDAGQDAAEDKSRLARGQKARSIRHGWQQANDRGAERGRGSSGEDSQSGGESTGSASDGQSSQQIPNIVVWDGSVEVAGRVVNKGESLRAASDGQMVSGPSSSTPVTNAPRPDMVKVAPGLFADGEIVSGPVSEAIAKRFDRYGHRDRNSRDESTSWLGDDAPPDGYVETYGLGTKQEPRNRDERNSRPKAPPDGYTETYGLGTKQEPRNRDERNSRSENAPPDGYTERYAYGAPGKDRPSGLYVWVRDGVVTLNRDGRQVEVAAGNAAVATEDHMALLDHVPNFMRFDDTPTPSDGGRRFPDAFRATDGSAMGACTVR